MVSRRTYLTIAIMFVILFFMFQFTGVMKEQLNNYESNRYAKEDTQALTKEDAYSSRTTAATVNTAKVLYVGKTKSSVGKVVSAYASYTKQTFAAEASFENCKNATAPNDQLLVIDGAAVVKTDRDVEFLENLVGKGRTIVFARLPDFSLIKENETLRDILGIYEAYSNEVQLYGMHLYSGFLLGGEALYEVQTPEEKKRQDLALTVPWYVTGNSCKTYMVGTLTDEVYQEAFQNGIGKAYRMVNYDSQSLKNSLLPAIIWRNSYEDARIFCINVDFMTDDSGTGILTAITSERDGYGMYPVINAQNLVVANFPVFTSENEQEIQKRYSQSAQSVYQDVVWPSVISLTEKMGFQMSCMMTPQLSYEDGIEPDGSNVSYYMKLLNEQNAEAGWSATSLEQWDVGKKLKNDLTFWNQYAKDYDFVSLYVRDDTELAQVQENPDLAFKTVVTENFSGSSPVVGYGGENVTVQHATDHADSHTFREDFNLRCRETALGYTNITMDLYALTYPQSDADAWQNLSRTIAGNVATYWKPYEGFSHTTLSQSDTRIRRFLALDYTQTRKGDTIQVTINSFDTEAFFLLRMYDETLAEIKGGHAKKLEDGFYLIQADEPAVSVKVKQTSEW